MKRLYVWMLVLCLLLSACGGGEEETTETTVPTEATVQYTEAVPETTQFPTEVPTEPTEPPVQEDPDTINPLTGETLDQADNTRPFAIMMNNHAQALPHHGVSHADVVYETLVEGGMTRFMALFTDPAGAGPIGSVRSARPPYVGFCQAYDALYCSASGMDSVLGMVTSGGVDYINALIYEGSYFYRNQSRLNRGVAWEHTLFIDGEDFLQLALDRQMRTTRKEGQGYGFVFDDTVNYQGEAANTAKIYFQKGGKTTTCTYDGVLGDIPCIRTAWTMWTAIPMKRWFSAMCWCWRQRAMSCPTASMSIWKPWARAPAGISGTDRPSPSPGAGAANPSPMNTAPTMVRSWPWASVPPMWQ